MTMMIVVMMFVCNQTVKFNIRKERKVVFLFDLLSSQKKRDEWSFSVLKS